MDEIESASATREHPTVRAIPVSRAPRTKSGRNDTGRSAAPREASMPRILVIDDKADKRLELTSALRGAGFDARAVCSADAPLEVSGSEFDVAIVDLMLHGTNRFELARQLKTTRPPLRLALPS